MQKSNMHRAKKIIGVILILIGMLLIMLPILCQYYDCVQRWENDLDAFGRKYTSIWDCFWSRSKGAILVSLLLGSVPINAGIHYLFGLNQKTCT